MVTQDDIDAAKEYYREERDANYGRLSDAVWDIQERFLSKAFARHRLATRPASSQGLEEALAGFDDDYMTSDVHHPGYVLIPTAKFEAIRKALTDLAGKGTQP